MDPRNRSRPVYPSQRERTTELPSAIGLLSAGNRRGRVADLYLRALESERKRLWAECRLKGLAKGTPERLRIEELDRLLAEHRGKPAG